MLKPSILGQQSCGSFAMEPHFHSFYEYLENCTKHFFLSCSPSIQSLLFSFYDLEILATLL